MGLFGPVNYINRPGQWLELLIWFGRLHIAMLFIAIHRPNELLNSFDPLHNLIEFALVCHIVDRPFELLDVLGIGDDLTEVVGVLNSLAVHWANKVLKLLSMLNNILKG